MAKVELRGISLIDLGFLEGWQGGAINMIDRITDKNDSQGSSPGWYPKVIRIPIHPPDSVNNWPHRWDPDNDSFYNNLLRPVVDYCADKDLYVIIDWHYITDTWDKVTQTSEFWEYMAPRFANDSHVLFELFNEPINRGGSNTDRWLSVRADMQIWVDIVRSYAPNNLILVGGPSWSQIIGPAATYPVSGNNIVYVSHIYPAHWLGIYGNTTWFRNQITTCSAVHPVIMTEWGFTTTSETLLNGTAAEYGQPLMDFIEGLGIGNTAWCASHNWGPPMFHADWTLRCGEGEMGCFVKDTLYEKRNDDIVFPADGDIEPAEIPFKRGVNLTNWLQTSSVQQIQFTKFTKQDLINIKSLGCDVIRLPINLHAMTNGGPDYTIDPLFYYFLDQIIDWAEELELHLILDNHTFDPAASTDPDIGDILVPVWMQMAEHYKDRSTYIYYEVLNEPHGISDRNWNEIQQTVIDAIRAVDQKHTIIVGPAGWNSYNNLKFMPEYEDDNLIYTFHIYDPFLFTHQGASWTNPSLVPLAGVPFPYDAARIPACPPELENTWISSNLAGYRNTGTVEHVKELIDIAADFKTARDVPLFCGEFGVYIPNSNNEDRIYWYNIVRSYLEEKGIAWTIWDYTGGFGLFEQGTSELFDYDLNIPLVEALGLNAPPQQEFILMPDVSEFDIYMDHIAPNIIESSWLSEGLLDYYSEDNPASGDYCIHWTGVDQYNSIAVRFSPVKDLSLLVDRGFAIDFWIRCDIPDAKIDIRFVDTKTEEPVDHPWRMRYTIDRNIAVWNGQWNHLQIPLNEFSEHGSWDNDRWYGPVGAFDWTATERFEIVPEYGDLEGIHFYFDDIRVVDPNPHPPGRFPPGVR